MVLLCLHAEQNDDLALFLTLEFSLDLILTFFVSNFVGFRFVGLFCLELRAVGPHDLEVCIRCNAWALSTIKQIEDLFMLECMQRHFASLLIFRLDLRLGLIERRQYRFPSLVWEDFDKAIVVN